MNTIEFLIKEGYYLKNKGFDYLNYILRNYKDILSFNQKQVFTEVAEHFGTNYMSVERDVRFVVHALDIKRTTKKEILRLIYEYNKGEN